MIQINLYRYRGENGTIVSPVQLPMEYTEMRRLVADAGMVLTNGEIEVSVIDVDLNEIELWSEINSKDIEG